jgi:hypothetical protein
MNLDEADQIYEKYRNKSSSEMTKEELERFIEAMAARGELIDNGDGTYSLPPDDLAEIRGKTPDEIRNMRPKK